MKTLANIRKICYYYYMQNKINNKVGYILVSPLDVANNFLKHGNEEGIEITPLKLQKLVYFLYKNYLQATNTILFSEEFEVWTRGPVIPSIYSEFKSYGSSPIKSYAKDSLGKSFIVREIGDFKECFNTVWEMYKNYGAYELSNLTHMEGTAWLKAKNKKHKYIDIEDIINEKQLK